MNNLNSKHNEYADPKDVTEFRVTIDNETYSAKRIILPNGVRWVNTYRIWETDDNGWLMYYDEYGDPIPCEEPFYEKIYRFFKKGKNN